MIQVIKKFWYAIGFFFRMQMTMFHPWGLDRDWDSETLHFIENGEYPRRGSGE